MCYAPDVSGLTFKRALLLDADEDGSSDAMTTMIIVIVLNEVVSHAGLPSLAKILDNCDYASIVDGKLA